MNFQKHYIFTNGKGFTKLGHDIALEPDLCFGHFISILDNYLNLIPYQSENLKISNIIANFALKKNPNAVLSIFIFVV
jgi:hypothetical protein